MWEGGIPDSRFQIPDSRFQITHDVLIFKGIREPCLPVQRPARWQAGSLWSVFRFQIPDSRFMKCFGILI
jgi:hypothetical protein